MRRIYLDNNATTPLCPQVVRAMLPYLKTHFGNASSIHSFGREVKAAIESGREKVAKLLGCHPEEIYFTSGGTESDNLALKGVAFANRDKGRHLITSSIEHHAVLESCHFLETQGFEVTYLRVDRYGAVAPDDLRKAIRDDTILVSIMHGNNEVGTIQPIAELSKIARGAGIYFHSDTVQSTGKLKIDVEEMGIDLLALSAHKLYGPKGVGAIYVRRGTHIAPLMHGGHHERNYRAGTENVAGIVGLGAAIEVCSKEIDVEYRYLMDLSASFYEGLEERIPDVLLNGDFENRLPGTLNISFKGVEAEAVILSLDLEGVAVASGSACTSGTAEPSHVLEAMGVAPELARSAVRFSFGRFNTKKDVDYVLKALPPIIERLRAMSPVESLNR
jgi:cysteine desulfurase